MKKIILLLGILLLSNCAVLADCEYTCVSPYDTNNKFMSTLSTITGAKFTSEQIAKAIFKKEIAKIATGDKIKINISSYSAKDLKNGIFKSMSITGKNVVIDGVHLSEIDMHTLCDFNYIKQKGKDVTIVEDMPLSVSFKMSEEDINNTMKTDKYKKVIEDVNRIGLGGIKISSTSVNIKSNKFYYNIGISIPFIKAEKNISIGADLKVKNGEIDFENTKLSSGTLNLDLSKIDFILNYLNPLDFSVKILDNRNAKVSIKNIDISNNVISTEGIAIVSKD